MKRFSWQQLGVMLLIGLGLILALSPFHKTSITLDEARQIARDINDRVDHVTAEQLGHWIIDKDPGFMIIDTRSAEEYAQYHIPDALNYPAETLFSEQVLSGLDKEKNIVLYSAGGTHAAQIWVLLKQLGFNNVSVLLGGLNYWVEVYSNPQVPQEGDPESEYFKYQFQVSAGKHLLGEGEIQSTVKPVPQKPVPVETKKMQKKKGDEGC
jgi:sulfur-carrier protein adenylyltransferase/sulfurtransferase